MNNSNSNFRVLVYLRSSSQESQHRQYNSIPAQLERIKRWSERTGSVIVKVYQDKASGKSFDRPDFKRMWRYARDHAYTITHVISAEVTRFGREGADYLKWFKKYEGLDIQLNFSDEWINFDIPEMYSLFYYRIGTAEAERLRTGKRTREVKASIRQDGYYADTPPAPWKFPEERNAAGRKVLVPNEPAFSVYKRALKMFANGDYGQSEVRRYCDTEEYTICRSTFSRLLRNPLICGFVPIYGRSVGKTERLILETVPGEHPALITHDEFEKIQGKLRGRKSPKINKPTLFFRDEFPLKKLICCPDCHQRLRAYKVRNRHGTWYTYYDCADGHIRLNGSKAEALVQQILSTFTIREEETDLINLAASKAVVLLGKDTAKEQENIKKALANLEVHRKNLKKDYTKLGADLFREMINEAKKEEKTLAGRLSNLESSKQISLEMRQNMVKLLGNLDKWYENATGYQRHHFLKMLFPSKFVIQDGKILTPKVNRIVSYLCSFSGSYTSENKKSSAETLLFIEAEEEGFIRPYQFLCKR